MPNEIKEEKEEVTFFELLSIVSFLDKYSNMSKACEKELLSTYYEVMEISKNNGNWNVIINIKNKHNLVEFLTQENKKLLLKK